MPTIAEWFTGSDPLPPEDETEPDLPKYSGWRICPVNNHLWHGGTTATARLHLTEGERLRVDVRRCKWHRPHVDPQITPSFSVVVAADSRRGIGRDGGIPWDAPADRRYFAELTGGSVVIMGRRTWESLPERFRPLPNRFNVVLSHDPTFALELPAGARAARTFDEALGLAQDLDDGAVFVIGGAEVYEEAVVHDRCAAVYYTRVDGDFDCDRRFPNIAGRFALRRLLAVGRSVDVPYRVEYWARWH